MRAGRNRGLIVCLLCIGASWVVTLIAYRMPLPRSDRSPDVFSAYRARTELESLVGDGIAHPIGTPANRRVRDSILLRLAALGYETEVQSEFVCSDAGVCGLPQNIIARLPSNVPDRANDSILLAAHYDSVPAGPGASDDAAGVATILEIARILKRSPSLHHPVVLLFSDGEEAGLLGARLFVERHRFARNIGAAVNLEARGSSGSSLMFETGSANSWLMSLYERVIARPVTDSAFYAVYKTLHNDTDFSIFKSAQWQGFNFAFIDGIEYYHTARDTLSNTDLRSIQHQGDNVLASVLALGESGDGMRAQPPNDAVYFDVLSRFLIRWPVRASTLAAAGILGVLLLEIASLLHGDTRCSEGRPLSIRQVGWGVIGALACPLIACAASIATLGLLLALGKVPPLGRYSWIAHPAFMSLASGAFAAVAAGAISIWLSKHAGFWGFWAGSVLLFAILSLLAGILAPGTGFVPLLTAGAATIGVIPHVVAMRLSSPMAGWRIEAAALLPATVLFTVTYPITSLLYTAVGSIGWPIDALLLGLAASLLLPLLAAATMRLRRGILMLAILLALGGLLMTLLLPTYSSERAQRVNLSYQVNEDEGRAYWVAEPDSGRLPKAIATAAAFESERKPSLAGGWISGFHAPAPFRALPAPQLLRRSVDHPSPEITRYHVHVQSSRGAPEIIIEFPGAAGVRNVIDDASGERLMPLAAVKNGATRLRLVGIAPAGIDISFESRQSSLRAQLTDQSFSIDGGEFLQRRRPANAIPSQNGDTTVVRHTAVLDSAADP